VKPRRIIEVEWQDHSFSYGEYNPTDAYLSRATTCGYYVDEDESVIRIALSVSNEKFNEVQVIDKRMVTRRRNVR
jgi:hypothetical protein